MLRLVKNLQSFNQPRTYPFAIKSCINCNSKNMVYIVNCHQCKKQYVGCTSNTSKTRIRRHLSDISNERALNISAASRHFVSEHNMRLNTFSVMGIKKVWNNCRGGDIRRKRLIRKAYWIFFHTRVPDGLKILDTHTKFNMLNVFCLLL